jgi:hypothetical protein
MSKVDSLNPLARRVWNALIADHPDWSEYFGTCGEDDLEAAIPAPTGSNAGHLVIFTANGTDLWLRFRPPSMCYSVDDETELVDVIRQLLRDKVSLVVIMRGNEWAGTTLIRQGVPGDIPQLEPGEVAQVVSWSGKYDRIIRAEKSA